MSLASRSPETARGGGERESLESLALEQARALIASTRDRLPGWDPPPVDPLLLAETLGIPVIETPLGEWDALLVPVPSGGFRILCNSQVRNASRRRFSVAHEIAHTFLPDAAESLHMRSEQREVHYTTDAARRVERVCDMAAAELLMPGRAFGAALAEVGLVGAAVPLLAERFGVSLEAAALRIVETSAAPCAVGFFHFAHRPSFRPDGAGGGRRTQDPGVERQEYRVKRAFRSRGFPFLFPRGKSVPRDSAVHLASFGRSEVASTSRFSLGRVERTLQVGAFPLPKDLGDEGPPLVCAIFRLSDSPAPQG